jgi:predicted acetyltransferase
MKERRCRRLDDGAIITAHRAMNGIDVRPARDSDFEQIAALILEAFRTPADRAAWARGGGYVLTEGGVVRAILHTRRTGQFFGGRAVPSAPVTSVAVEPLARGRGLSQTLLRAVLTQLRAAGAAVSVLYPSVATAYRRVGYEFAGRYIRYRVPVQRVPTDRAAIARIKAWDDAQASAVAASYRRAAAATNGLLDHSDAWWTGARLERDDRPIFRFATHDAGEFTGALVYQQTAVPGGTGYAYTVDARTLHWHDADAARALLAAVALNRALATEFRWAGPPDDPLATLFPEPAIAVDWTTLWMCRLLNVPVALVARGYPLGITAAMEFTVDDPTLPENSGAFRLEVRDGQASAERIERARARIDVGVLAALYTGQLAAREAVRIGRLTDATESEIAGLEALFAGPKSWLADIF